MTATNARDMIPSHPLRPFDYFSLNAYWFALSYLWNSIGPIILPTLVAGLVPDSQKGSALGLISSFGLIIAVVVQPAAGAWSDSHNTRWGRRRPYIVGGTLFDIVFLLMIAFSGNYVMLLTAYVLLQVSSNIAHGPFQGYIPQLVPQIKHGAVSGVARFLEIVGIIVTSIVTGRFVGEGQVFTAILAIILFLVLSMAITAIFVDERPFDGAPETFTPAVPSRSRLGLSDYVRVIIQSREFIKWLLSRLFILLGGNLVRNYALFFLTDVLHMPNPAAEVGNLLAVIALAIALVVYPAGTLSDRWGRKGLVVFSGLLGAAGAILMITATTLQHILIFGGIIGVSIGIFLSVNWAWATDLIPPEGGGLYLGISNLATAGSGVLAATGGFLLDYFNARTQNLGYTALFIFAATCYLVGTLLAATVSDRHKTKTSTVV